MARRRRFVQKGPRRNVVKKIFQIDDGNIANTEELTAIFTAAPYVSLKNIVMEPVKFKTLVVDAILASSRVSPFCNFLMPFRSSLIIQGTEEASADVEVS